VPCDNPLTVKSTNNEVGDTATIRAKPLTGCAQSLGSNDSKIHTAAELGFPVPRIMASLPVFWIDDTISDGGASPTVVTILLRKLTSNELTPGSPFKASETESTQELHSIGTANTNSKVDMMCCGEIEANSVMVVAAISNFVVARARLTQRPNDKKKKKLRLRSPTVRPRKDGWHTARSSTPNDVFHLSSLIVL
jgi:hypothetical protein